MISFTQKGDFDKVYGYLKKAKKVYDMAVFRKYGDEGVAALEAATPKKTGLTSKSWSYNIENKDGSITISFKNSNIQNGVNVAILLQYDHGTRNGGFVQGIDYINPAVKPIFEKIANTAWKEMTSL